MAIELPLQAGVPPLAVVHGWSCNVQALQCGTRPILQRANMATTEAVALWPVFKSRDGTSDSWILLMPDDTREVSDIVTWQKLWLMKNRKTYPSGKGKFVVFRDAIEDDDVRKLCLEGRDMAVVERNRQPDRPVAGEPTRGLDWDQRDTIDFVRESCMPRAKSAGSSDGSWSDLGEKLSSAAPKPKKASSGRRTAPTTTAGWALPPVQSQQGFKYYCLGPWHLRGPVVRCGQDVILSYIVSWTGSPYGRRPKGFANLEDAVNFSQVSHDCDEVIIETKPLAKEERDVLLGRDVMTEQEAPAQKGDDDGTGEGGSKGRVRDTGVQPVAEGFQCCSCCGQPARQEGNDLQLQETRWQLPPVPQAAEGDRQEAAE